VLTPDVLAVPVRAHIGPSFIHSLMYQVVVPREIYGLMFSQYLSGFTSAQASFIH
jgi:hypothetical protein